MLQTSNAAIPTENMVTYKFKVPDLADFFESFTPEQSHIALEGALNVIFGRSSTMVALTPLEEDGVVEPLLSEDEEKENYEDQITAEVGFALYTHQLTANAGDNLLLAQVPEDYESTELYKQMEDMFSNIVNKLALEFSEDKYNQDIVTLMGEMEFFSRIELFTYNYNTDCGLLMVTLAAMLS